MPRTAAISKPPSDIATLLFALDRAYEKKSWHGSNLRGSLRGLTARQAAWRPRPDRHCIADVVVHAAYWKYAVCRRLTGEERGSFPLKGSNWIAVASPLDEATWRGYVRLLDTQHRALRAAIAALPAARLHDIPPSSKLPHLDVIAGIAAHDLYHAGQIQLLKALQKPSK